MFDSAAIELMRDELERCGNFQCHQKSSQKQFGKRRLVL